MYNGEVSVEESDLVTLLASAKSLGIKGLCEVDNSNRDESLKPPTRKRTKKCPAVDKSQLPPSLEVTALSDTKGIIDEIIEVEPKVQPEITMLQPFHESIVESEADLMTDDWYTLVGGSGDDRVDGGGGDDGDIGEFDENSTSDKALACAFCPKIFASNWHLKRHVLTHTKENRFRCDVCHKDFSRNDNLKSHMKMHTGAKPFDCYFCPSSFI